MATILLEEMEFYAYHGCFKEEQLIGNRFVVNVALETDTDGAEKSDNLVDTVNYQAVYELIKSAMEQKSHLLEHLCRRMLDAICQNFPEVTSVKLRVSKMNPPMGGKMRCVSLEMDRTCQQ